MKNTITFLAVVFLCLFTGCINPVNTYTYSRNEYIPSDIRAEITELDSKAFSSIQNNDYESVLSMFADTARKQMGSDPDFLSKMQKIAKGKILKAFADYYFVSSTDYAPINISFGEGDSAYYFTTGSLTKKTYISMTLATDSDNNSQMFSIIYGNYGGKWKIITMRISDFLYHGKSTTDFYSEAKVLKNKGDLLDAANIIVLGIKCSQPVGTYFNYKKIDEIRTFAKEVSDEAVAKFQLPITLTNIKTRPEIFKVNIKVLKPGIFPVIQYQSVIDINDTVSLKAENMEVRKNIGRIFNGIDQNNNYIIYEIVNTIPDGTQSVPFHRFVQKT